MSCLPDKAIKPTPVSFVSNYDQGCGAAYR